MSNNKPVALKQVKDVRAMLMHPGAKEQLAAVASKHVTPERMLRLLGSALRTTPDLANCDPMTLLGALMTCASLGLEPNTPLGHAYLIPFKNRRAGTVDVQLIIGYRGMIDLVRRSGVVRGMHADVVYQREVDEKTFSFCYGTGQHLRHTPLGGDKGAPVYAYFYVQLEDGEMFDVVPWEDILKVKASSQSGQRPDSPWNKHIVEMAKKTAVRRLFKYLPMAVDQLEAIVGVVDEGGGVDFASVALDQSGDIIEAVASTAGAGDDEVVDAGKGEKEPTPDPKQSHPKREEKAKPAAKPQRASSREQAEQSESDNGAEGPKGIDDLPFEDPNDKDYILGVLKSFEATKNLDELDDVFVMYEEDIQDMGEAFVDFVKFHYNARKAQL